MGHAWWGSLVWAKAENNTDKEGRYPTLVDGARLAMAKPFLNLLSKMYVMVRATKEEWYYHLRKSWGHSEVGSNPFSKASYGGNPTQIWLYGTCSCVGRVVQLWMLWTRQLNLREGVSFHSLLFLSVCWNHTSESKGPWAGLLLSFGLFFRHSILEPLASRFEKH